jgi:hypothetical protein
MNRSFIREETLTFGSGFPSIAAAYKRFAFTRPLSSKNSRPILFFGVFVFSQLPTKHQKLAYWTFKGFALFELQP